MTNTMEHNYWLHRSSYEYRLSQVLLAEKNLLSIGFSDFSNTNYLNKFLNVTRKWYQYFINIELIGSIVACFTQRYDIRVVVKPIYLFYMCTNKIAPSELMTICSRTSPCGFSAFLFPVLQPRFITCWGIIAAGSA